MRVIIFFMFLAVILFVTPVMAEEGVCDNCQISYVGMDVPKPSEEKLLSVLQKFSSCFERSQETLTMKLPKRYGATIKIVYNKFGEKVDREVAGDFRNPLVKEYVQAVLNQMAYCPLTAGFGMYGQGKLQESYYKLHLFVGKQKKREDVAASTKYYKTVTLHQRSKAHDVRNTCLTSDYPDFSYTIMADGSIKELNWLKKSSSERCNDAVSKMIYDSQPYPKAPPALMKRAKRDGLRIMSNSDTFQ